MICPMDGMDGASEIRLDEGLAIRACLACPVVLGATVSEPHDQAWWGSE